MPPSTFPLIPSKDSLTAGVKYSVRSPYANFLEVNQDLCCSTAVLPELFM